jgi:Tol biopolymer transport system component
MRTSGDKGPSPLPLAGFGCRSPAFSRRASRLVYAQEFQDTNIWSLTLPQDTHTPGLPRMVVASSRMDDEADFSPDGRRIAFQSDRSGSTEIWVCEKDGSHPRQVTSFGHGDTGMPRWSPDGLRIAFDSNIDGQFHIYVVGADGGVAKAPDRTPFRDSELVAR